MLKHTTSAGAVILVAVFGVVGPAEAKIRVTHFKGSQAQVRSACTGPGMTLYDNAKDTTCINENNNTGVSCGPDGNCVGTGPARTFTSPSLGWFGVQGAPPASLVESGGDDDDQPPPSPPSDGPIG